MKKWILVVLFMVPLHAMLWADDQALPDSLLTMDNLHLIYLTEPEKAQRILDELRTRKLYDEWDLDWMQADLYFDSGKYRLAIHYFERVEKYEAVRNNQKWYMHLLNSLLECYWQNNDLDKTLQTAIRLIEITKMRGETSEMGRAYSFMGRAMLRQGNEKLADEYLALAEKYYEESGSIEYLYDHHFTVATLMSEGKQYGNISVHLGKAEQYLEQVEKTNQSLPVGAIDYERARLYALASEVAFREGEKQEAAGYYRKFLASPFATDGRVKIYIVPYLLNIKDYKSAISITGECMDMLRAETDTLGRNMSAALDYMVKAHEMAGETEKALSFSKSRTTLIQNIMNKEQEQVALELVTIHNVQEKEALIVEQQHALRRRNILLGSALIIVVLASMTILLIIRNLRRTKTENLAMIRQIKEMQLYREKLEELKQKKEDLHKIPDSECDLSEVVSTDKLFALADDMIRKEKLYLNPELVRDDIIKLLSVKKSEFIQAINEHTDGSFTDYINNIRMELALTMLEKATDNSIECIAEDAGFGSVRSFYRQFKYKYNMSPAEYRKLIKREKL